MFPITRVTFIFVIAAMAPFVSSQVYKWTDENGVVHHGDERPSVTHKQFQFKGYSEIQMQDNIRAREAVARERSDQPRKPISQSRNQKHHQDVARQQEAQLKQAKCEGYRERIKRIDSRLRAGGYSVNRGNRLRAERRELHGKLAWECIRS